MSDELNKLKKEIRERINILDIAKRYLNLKRVGVNYASLSPFKHETRPSFMVSPSKGIFKCFSSGIGGDVIKLYSLLEKIPEEQAIIELAKEANIDLDKYANVININNEIYKYFNNMKIISDFYYKKNRQVVLEYLKKRGLSENIADYYKIGYTGSNYNDLALYLTKNQELLNFAKEYSIIRSHDDKLYDFQTNAIVIPLFENNKIYGFLYRKIKQDSNKYITIPNNKFFKKSNYLYNIDRAINTISDYNYIIIVEGVFDLYSLVELGYYNVISTLGVNINNKSVYRISQISKNIVLGFDNDETGLVNTINFIERYKDLYGINISIIDYEKVKDANEYLFLNKDINILDYREYLYKKLDNVSEFYKEKIQSIINKDNKTIVNVKIKKDFFTEKEKLMNDINVFIILLYIHFFENGNKEYLDKLRKLMLMSYSDSKVIEEIKKVMFFCDSNTNDIYEVIKEVDEDYMSIIYFVYQYVKDKISKDSISFNKIESYICKEKERIFTSMLS